MSETDDKKFEATPAWWFAVRYPPEKTGWYPALTLGGDPTYRLWEDGSWWYFTHIEPDEQGEDGGWQLVPNNSISYWAMVHLPSIVGSQVEGTA